MTPSRRDYPDRPLLGVGAIIICEQRVLLARRAHAPLQGEWSIPGGLVEAGETTKEAVIREVREETELTIEPVNLVEVFERILRDDFERVQYHYVLIDYVCRIISGTPTAQSDVNELRWATIEELELLKVSTETGAVIRKAFSMWEGKKSS